VLAQCAFAAFVDPRGHRGMRFAPQRRIVPRSTRHASLVSPLLLALASCTTVTLGHVPVVSTRPVTAADLARPPALTRTVEGRSCVWVVGVVPVGFPSLGAAVDQAIEAGGAQALWDADIRYRIRYVPPLGTACYLARGRAP
jgi:hypothetical protein